jgi:hypothetical protein
MGFSFFGFLLGGCPIQNTLLLHPDKLAYYEL